MSKAEQSSTPEAGSATAPLDDGYKRHFRYQKIGLVALLIIGLLSAVTFWQVNMEKDVAVQNQQVLSQSMDKDLCKVYPETESCKISAQIKAAPTEPVIPKDGTDGKDGQPGENGQDGKDGKNGADGRGVTKFDQSTGNLIVTYTDGQNQDLGRIVGRDGKDGATGATGPAGADGRGIVSSAIEGGALMVTYTDGSVQNAGFVVGPKGDKGDTGATGAAGRDGIDGQNGAPGLTPTGINSDIYGTVTVTYNDGSSAQVGKIILPNIEIFTCENNVMTLKLTNGPAHTAPAVCQPQTIIPPSAVTPIK